jgi:mxaJ protein
MGASSAASAIEEASFRRAALGGRTRPALHALWRDKAIGGALAAIMLAVCGSAAAADEEAAPGSTLRVCADPNNLPFSNAKGEGFENELAQLVAQELHQTVSYTWWAQRRGFIRNTLKAGKCDVIMGVPPLDMIATTRPYYRSTYVFVSRRDRKLGFSSLQAPELRTLKIGVHLIGDDGANTPPADALAVRHIVDNVKGFMIYGDYRQDAPPARLVDAVERGEVDVAAVWGPLAGWAAKRSPVPLQLVPITDTEAFRPLLFQFAIAMGVRKGDTALAGRLDAIIAKRRDDIRALLERFGVPLVAEP